MTRPTGQGPALMPAPVPTLRDVQRKRGADAARDPQSSVDEQVANLREYSRALEVDARNDRVALWALKLPVIVGSTAAATLAALGPAIVSMIASTVAALCAGVDAVRPRGLLFAVHRRAANDAAREATNIESEWRATQLEVAESGELARRAAALVRQCNAVRTRIDQYVSAVEGKDPHAPSATDLGKPLRGQE